MKKLNKKGNMWFGIIFISMFTILMGVFIYLSLDIQKDIETCISFCENNGYAYKSSMHTDKLVCQCLTHKLGEKYIDNKLVEMFEVDG